MECGLLFSGGPDSSLAGLALEPFYDVTMVTVQFGVTDDWEQAKTTAEQLGFPFRTIRLDRTTASEAVDRMLESGSPRDGIQYVHARALEATAEMGFDAVADGTRRDDRVPSISRAQAQRLEDRYDVDYLAPLSGFGRRAVDRLVEATFALEVGSSTSIARADYETELRTLMAEEVGEDAVGAVFPSRRQTHVRGYR